MKITAKCILANNTEIDISVDLDYVETLDGVYDYVNDKLEVKNSYVKRIKNEDEIENALIENKVTIFCYICY